MKKRKENHRNQRNPLHEILQNAKGGRMKSKKDYKRIKPKARDF